MFIQRALVTIILLPIGLAAIWVGGIPYGALIALIIGLAAVEYVRLMRLGGLQPPAFLVVAGSVLFVSGRAWNGFESAPWIASLLVLVAMTHHLLAYEKGRDQAATDFGVTLGGIFYLGWIGAYFISVRSLAYGEWWILLALPSVWMTDSAAYIFGKRFGKHKISRRISPNKTWEGYIAGVIGGTIFGAVLGYAWLQIAGPETGITPLRGLIVGFVLSVLTILGDLGESMFKRQVGAKDSGNLLPGHGGVFDRIDSWLWAAVITYYLAQLFVG